MAAPDRLSTIVNRSALVAHGARELRHVALDVLEAGLAAVAPRGAVARAISRDGDAIAIAIAGRPYNLADYDRVLVIGAGKASFEVLRGIEDVLGDVVSGGVVVVPRAQPANDRPANDERTVRILEADHPIPSRHSLEAADEILAVASSAGPRDLIVACFTGGSSALASRPAPGVTPDEKRELHRLLLGSGARIDEINAVRKHVSAFKAGRVAVSAAPATIINLTVCDVVGCAPDLITDPTVADTSTAADAIDVLRRHGIWDTAATSVRHHLQSGAEAESPSLAGIDILTAVIVTAELARQAMVNRAAELGRRAFVVDGAVEGEARVAGAILAGQARGSLAGAGPFGADSVVVACGGEATVAFAAQPPRFGDGGPNQELVLAAALELADRPAAILAVDSDGSDGGGRYAGAIADGLTVRRAADRGIDLRSALREHTTSEALRSLGDAVQTGSTGTNVNDLVALVLG